MNKIKVVSKKYDGTLRAETEANLVFQDENVIVLLATPNTPDFIHKRKEWERSPDGVLQLYFTERWYNVWHIADQNSGFNKIYANIAMPPQVTENMLTWVDLDLDIRVHMDGAVELLDEEEFAVHQRSMGYPAEVVNNARAAAKEGLRLAQEGLYPFDHEVQVANYWRYLTS